MKKIYKCFNSFLKKRRILSFFILTIILLVTLIAVVISELRVLAAVPFGFSIACFIRLITYKTGKIPFISVDKTWQTMRLKYSSEELEEKYKEMSINRATTYFLICLFSFPLWIIVEILTLI